jgi:predicted acyl esterase
MDTTIDWHDLLSKPVYQMKSIKDVFVQMRDGVKIAADIYAPDAEGKFPALLSLSCYGKDVQKLPVPQGPLDSRIGNGGMEAGDSEYFVTRGYVHVIADSRGTGKSEGSYGHLGKEEQVDGYEMIEWIAQQPWCDGNVGMLGMSYFAVIQYLIAALNPPHLRAIFANDAYTDMYRHFYYTGGILLYGFLSQWWPHVPVHTPDTVDLPREELTKKVNEAKNNLDVQACPVVWMTLDIPDKNPTMFDALIYPTDGPYYWERSAYTKFAQIKVPTFLLSRWTAHYNHLAGAFDAFEGIDAPKRLRIGLTGTPIKGFGRPWNENHDIILRWYDHWLKGVDTGIMDEPPVNIFIQEENKWRYEYEWPLKRTNWSKYYLRQTGILDGESPVSNESPDGFTNNPALTPEQRVPGVRYTTAPLENDTEVSGPPALYFYAELDMPDANWMVEIHDVAPDGTQRMVTMHCLKASHREIDLDKSKPYKPYHPHTREVSIKPGEINEYAMEIADTSYLFKEGHRIQLIIKGQNAVWEGPEGFRQMCYHLNNRSETRHTIYHTEKYPSYLLLPVIPK